MQQYNNQNQISQPVMTEPPSFISNKDLLYLKDAMSWELLAMKKCFHASQQCLNPRLKQAIEQAGMMHQRHYQTLLRHVDPNKTLP
ncbi:hypothetical protein [Halothermothrix orenii]|uniref:hypothetical protein n=1 Tax=Halothermothrix orenii TaxID=31909 RepID=UPI0002E93D9B|nr:hypothetical protein [Halothermothrix orenii]